jgi:hypothetical protein
MANEQIEECRRLIKLVDDLLHDSDPAGEAHKQIHELAFEFVKLHPRLPAGTKIERADEPPYLSDDLVEQIAVLHNGGKWPDDYKESHRQHWRAQAVKIIDLVKLYLANPLYKVTPPKPTGGRVFGFTVDSITQREGGYVDLDRLDRGQTGKIDIVDQGKAT